jgi:hypothetical protein
LSIELVGDSTWTVALPKSESDLTWVVSQAEPYQIERNKEIGVLKKESKCLSRILLEMKLELDVLMATVNAQQASEREEKICYNDDIRNRTAATFIQCCWQRLLARKELQMLQK